MPMIETIWAMSYLVWNGFRLGSIVALSSLDYSR